MATSRPTYVTLVTLDGAVCGRYVVVKEYDDGRLLIVPAPEEVRTTPFVRTPVYVDGRRGRVPASPTGLVSAPA